jgi:hypothetical protein
MRFPVTTGGRSFSSDVNGARTDGIQPLRTCFFQLPHKLVSPASAFYEPHKETFNGYRRGR